MSYAVEELREGIVELFDNAALLCLRPWDFGTLPLAIALREFRSLDAPRLKMKVTQVARVVLTPIRQARPRSPLVCFRCGARAAIRRCPG